MNTTSRSIAAASSIALAALLAFWIGQRSAGSGTGAVHAPAKSAATDFVPDRWNGLPHTAEDQSAISLNVPVAPATPALPDGPFGEVMEQLQQRAEAGSAEAAKRLADGLQRCGFAPRARSVAELESQADARAKFGMALVDGLIQQGKDAGADVSKIPTFNSEEMKNDALAANIELARDCAGAPRYPESQVSMFRWLERAAELGDIEAQLTYWREAVAMAGYPGDAADIVRRKPLAAKYLDAARARGDWRALAAIGEASWDGMFAEPDPAQSYAFFYAASLAPQAAQQSLPWNNGLGGMMTGNLSSSRYLARKLATASQGLSAQQVEEARRRGAAIYARCCGG